ncbi:Uncharacterised protein [Vibrio cholerae]|nr:Uncharacterised protein [Vibrio cholerae]CSA22524.1 Uncharacterised protein [Vibrio cholerae]CSA27561.1 Uncharacterised protein [Vibrio cholerae]CSA30201.1 Uncharacterised protein [Vibrio cholerae]CSA32420.1 Uncharacterised protein [Vibrio cholerae]
MLSLYPFGDNLNTQSMGKIGHHFYDGIAA